MTTPEMEQWWIDKFQENLGAIRKVAGWTTQRLADELGVARQTVSNLETGRTPMTKLQYLALRTVFNAQIARSDNRELATIIRTLVDDPVEQRILDAGGSLAVLSDNADHQIKHQGDPDNSGTSVSADKEDKDNREDKEDREASTAVSARSAKKTSQAKPALSVAMQALAIITAALASGAAAGILAYLTFPGGSDKR